MYIEPLFHIFIYQLLSEKPRWTIKPESKNVTVGDTVTFECSAEGSPRPKKGWYINDQLRTSEILHFTYYYLLILLNIYNRH